MALEIRDITDKPKIGFGVYQRPIPLWAKIYMWIRNVCRKS